MLWLTATLIGASCSVLTQFDPEGQPCDITATSATQCLSGYRCGPDQRCTKGAIADAGMTSVDGGSVAVDAGAPIVDAGSVTPDAGSPATDAGAPGVDAGADGG